MPPSASFDPAVPRRRIGVYCPQCGSLYPAAAPSCPHCLESVPDESAARTPARCPACAIALVAQPFADVEIDRCPSCAGAWFDTGEPTKGHLAAIALLLAVGSLRPR